MEIRRSARNFGILYIFENAVTQDVTALILQCVCRSNYNKGVTQMNKVFAWIDIPVQDIARAVAFYSQVTGQKMQIEEQGPRRVATLYFEEGHVGGTLVQSEGFEPGGTGPHVYLAAGTDIDGMMHRVNQAGGKIIGEKTPNPAGFYATFQDTEGNVLSLFGVS